MCVTGVKQCMIRSGSPLRQGPTQRRRIADDSPSFTWKRLLDVSTPYDNLVLKEQPNPDIFDNILANHKDHPMIRSHLKEILEPFRAKFAGCGWSRTVNMTQKEYKCFPASYKGCNKLGRSTSQLTTFLPRKILNTMYHDTHSYIDLVNANFSILVGAFGHLEIPTMKWYVANRDEVFRQFGDMGLSSKETKMAFLSIIGACPKMPSAYGFEEIAGNEEKIRAISECHGVLSLCAEVKMCYDQLSKDYPDFVTGMNEYAIREGKGDHRGGVALSAFCRDVEDGITRIAVKTLQEGQSDDLSKNIVWKFDGIIVPKIMVYDGHDALMRIQTAVRDEIGLDVKYSFQPIDIDIFPGCGAGFQIDPYRRFKTEFERSYFKLLQPMTYCRVYGGAAQMMNDREWKLAHMEKPKNLLEQWEQDPDKLTYTKMDCYPPPMEVPPGAFNTWKGFAAASYPEPMEESEIQDRVELWKTHVDNMTNHDPMAREAFHDLIAHYIQKPAIKTPKIIYIRSLPGVGKDQMKKFLLSMLGGNVAFSVDTFEELVTTKSAIMEGKVLCVITESDYRDFSDKNFKKLKAITGRDTYLVEQKNEKAYISTCILNLIMFTNDWGSMNMTMMERRFICAEVDGRIANKPEYNVPFADYILDQANQAAVFRWYNRRDISGFNPFSLIQTKVQVSMASQAPEYSSPCAIIFKNNLDNWIENAKGRGNPHLKMISDWDVQIAAEFLNQEYFGYHNDIMKWKGCETISTAAQKMSRLMVEANAQATKFSPSNIIPMEKKKKRLPGDSNPRFVYILHIPTVQRWIREMLAEGLDNTELEGPLPDAFAKGNSNKK